MSSVSSPFGLRPAFSPSGTLRQSANPIASGYGSTIYHGSPVQLSSGNLIVGVTAGSWAGVFAGVQFVDSDGRGRVSTSWPASTVATEIRGYVSIYDQDTVFEIQADDTLDVDAIGQLYDISVSSGQTTGYSTQSLATASQTNDDLLVVGLREGPDNAWGDAYPVVLVKLNNQAFTTGQ